MTPPTRDVSGEPTMTGAGRAADLHVGRLSLHIADPAMDAQTARALARRVAEGLAPDLLRAPGTAALDGLEVSVVAAAGEQPDLLARRIVDQVGRVLARERTSGAPDGGTV